MKAFENLRFNRITQPEEYSKGHDIYLLLKKSVGKNSTTVIILETVLQG